jgi:hypothetical protein
MFTVKFCQAVNRARRLNRDRRLNFARRVNRDRRLNFARRSISAVR